jgi:toxin YxiD
MLFRRIIFVPCLLLGMMSMVSCQPPTPHAEASRSVSASSHDLAVDEQHGGHTLKRHVGRTDDELQQRLERESNISAASTYTDRGVAEKTVAAALRDNGGKIDRWLQRGPSRPNLVVDYTNPTEPIGRTRYRGAMGSVPCDHAIVVLRPDGDSYYVLTSYPECRP